MDTEIKPKPVKKTRKPIKKAELKRIVAMREAGMTVAKIAEHTGRAVSSIWRVLSIEKIKLKEPLPPATPVESSASVNVIPYNISPDTKLDMKPVTEKAGPIQRVAIALCRFLGVTDNMYKQNY